MRGNVKMSKKMLLQFYSYDNFTRISTFQLFDYIFDCVEFIEGELHCSLKMFPVRFSLYFNNHTRLEIFDVIFRFRHL